MDRLRERADPEGKKKEWQKPWEKKEGAAEPEDDYVYTPLAMKVGLRVIIQAGYGGKGGRAGQDFTRFTVDTPATVTDLVPGSDVYVKPDANQFKWRVPIQALKLPEGKVSSACKQCRKPVVANTGSEVGPGTYLHLACQITQQKQARLNFIPLQVVKAFYPEILKTATFNLFHPGPVLNEFNPELLHETVDHPESTYNPLISDVGPGPEGAYVPTSPAGGLGMGRDGKTQVLDGAPLRKENDIRGYAFTDEFYSQTEPIDSTLLRAASSKRADAAEYKIQFADFIKKAMGEVAASFIAAFKVTQRSLMDKIPGVGVIQLDKIEQPISSGYNLQNIASRVKYLVAKLNDGDIQDAINDGWAQASVWNSVEVGGFVYEVFVRPESLDQDTLALNYSFVVGTKGM